jgi:hypothetical protein
MAPQDHEIATVIAGLVAEAVAASLDVASAAACLARVRDDELRSMHERALAEALAALAWDACGVRRKLSLALPEARARDVFTAALAASLRDRLERARRGNP